MSCHAHKERETEKDLEDKFYWFFYNLACFFCVLPVFYHSKCFQGTLEDFLELISAETTIVLQ